MKGFSVQRSQLIADEVKQNLTSCGQVPASAPPTLAKKKRTLSLNTEMDSSTEVVALSPKTLLATNRFVCEVCGKGFKREQNLQLHRRGHNLPWRLKKKEASDEEAKKRKKVFVCPEPSCPHHEPHRALGDPTGIKKHFFRKHGEKKWRCEKCGKKYAVFSDWKAHAKVCGTKEYRCDCGTVFSRRDSFITHRSFCGILMTEETERLTGRAYPLAINQNQLFLPHEPTALKTSVNYSSTIMNCFSHENPSFIPSQVPPHLSATELLQKAAEMGTIMSKESENNGLFSSQEMVIGSFCNSCSELGGIFEEEMGKFMAPKREGGGMTRDFLGLVDPSYNDFLFNLAWKNTFIGSSSSSYEHHRKI